MHIPPFRPGASAPSAIARAQADSDAQRSRAAAIEARNAAGIAGLAARGLTMTQGSWTALYKAELASAVDADGDGSIAVAELAAGAGQERAQRLHGLLDRDGDGRVGLEEFKDAIPDPFREAGFRRQLAELAGAGNADPAMLGALHRRHAAQYDAQAVLGALARAVDTSA